MIAAAFMLALGAWVFALVSHFRLDSQQRTIEQLARDANASHEVVAAVARKLETVAKDTKTTVFRTSKDWRPPPGAF